jgi:hypothetical protein
MKRSPLARKRAKPRRTRPELFNVVGADLCTKRKARIEDRSYLAWVRTRPCVYVGARDVQRLWPCSGPTEPDHESMGRGKGTKADDDRSYPICHRHHMDRHGLCGPFKGWVRDQLRAWIAARIDEAQAKYEESFYGQSIPVA